MEMIRPDSPESRSADLIGSNLEKLKDIFPEAFEEGKINFDVLKQLLRGEIDEKDERYGLNWNGKRRARQLALTPSMGTLRPCPEESVDWNTTQNLMVEGDNLEVLKLLQKIYAGKVKFIYIDPPYNTGKDFVYPDDFRDNIKNYLELTGQVEAGRKITTNNETSGRFHTEWLNMMYPRIKLARNLLKDDGVIFMSIGDQELGDLLLMNNELFGEENQVGIITRVSKKTSNKGNHLAPSKDSLLVYAKNIELLPPFMDVVDEKYADRFDGKDDRGDYALVGLYQAALDPRPNQRYWIQCPDGTFAIPPGNTLPDVIADGMNVIPKSSEDRVWRWSFDSYLKKKDLIVFKKTAKSPLQTPDRLQSSWNVYTKYYLADRLEEGIRPRDFLDDITNDRGTADLKALGLNDVFTFPKPVDLLIRIMTWIADPGALCLDFFAGSGTMGQAVFEINQSDGGHRRFVLVQLPEPTEHPQFPTIAEITKERLRCAIRKIKKENLLFPSDLGFRVFKLDSSNIRSWDPNSENLEQSLLAHIEHIKMDRMEEDILYELLLKLGVDLCVPIEKRIIAGKTVYSTGGGILMVCLAEIITCEEVEPLAQGIVDWHKELAPTGDTTCIFRDSGFANDVVKTNLAAILEQSGIRNLRSL